MESLPVDRSEFSWNVVCETFSMNTGAEGMDRIVDIFQETPFEEKVEVVYNMYKDDGRYNLFKKQPCKSNENAAKLRQRANLDLLNSRFISAAKLYTECAVTALPGSEELALAYGNRSAALFDLGRYVSSVIDIHRSLRVENCPGYLKPKLLHRRKECIEKVREQEYMNELCTMLAKVSVSQTGSSQIKVDIENITDYNYDWKFPLPVTNFKNKLLPGISEKIKLSYSEEYGVHMVAAQDIKPGELIMTSRPFVSSLYPSYYHTHCSNCFVRSEVLIACNTCSLTMFCSEQCYEAALNKYHRVECELLPLAVKLEKNREELLTLRLLMIITNQGMGLSEMMEHPVYKNPFQRTERNIDAKFDLDDYINVHNLEDNLLRSPLVAQFERTSMAAMLMHILKQSTFFDEYYRKNEISLEEPRQRWTNVERYVGNLILKILMVLQCNCQDIKERIEYASVHALKDPIMLNVSAIGCGLFTLTSLLNHSCDPNVFKGSYKNNVVYHSLHPINAGEQIFDEYGCHYLSEVRADRQDFLREQYFFICDCPACVGQWPVYRFLPREDRKLIPTKKISSEKLKKSSKRFRMVTRQSEGGAMVTNELSFFCQHLTLLHQCVQKPWYEHADCQEFIRRIIEYLADNRYSQSDVIY